MTSQQNFPVRHLTLMAPAVFVLLWSTGFIFSKAGVAYAEPFTLLFIRMSCAAILIFLLTQLLPVKWPEQPRLWSLCGVIGILVHGVYLGGVFVAIDKGVSAGLTSLVVGLQPLATVLLAAIWLGERLTRAKLAGVALGLAGITAVILSRGTGVEEFNGTGLLYCCASLVAIVIGTLLQKRYCGNLDLLPASFIQFLATAVFLGLLSLLFETRVINWQWEFVAIVAWMVIMLSLAAVLLLWWLVRHGEAGKVASYFYLVPPVVALEAWILFDEKLTLFGIVGMALCVTGVALVLRPSERPTALPDKQYKIQ